MKTYRTSEMIAMLEKHPNPEKLKLDCNGGKVNFKDGVLVWSDNGKPVELSLYGYPIGGMGAKTGGTIDKYKWQLVRTPVTWQEAIQAWLDGKTIRCVVPQEYSNGTRDIEFVFQCEDFLINNNEEPPYKSYFKYGTWYIEGDSDAVR